MGTEQTCDRGARVWTTEEWIPYLRGLITSLESKATTTEAAITGIIERVTALESAAKPIEWRQCHGAEVTALRLDDGTFAPLAASVEAGERYMILKRSDFDELRLQAAKVEEFEHRAGWLWQERIEAGKLFGVDLSRADERLQDVVERLKQECEGWKQRADASERERDHLLANRQDYDEEKKRADAGWKNIELFRKAVNRPSPQYTVVDAIVATKANQAAADTLKYLRQGVVETIDGKDYYLESLSKRDLMAMELPQVLEAAETLERLRKGELVEVDGLRRWLTTECFPDGTYAKLEAERDALAAETEAKEAEIQRLFENQKSLMAKVAELQPIVDEVQKYGGIDPLVALLNSRDAAIADLTFELRSADRGMRDVEKTLDKHGNDRKRWEREKADLERRLAYTESLRVDAEELANANAADVGILDRRLAEAEAVAEGRLQQQRQTGAFLDSLRAAAGIAMPGPALDLTIVELRRDAERLKYCEVNARWEPLFPTMPTRREKQGWVIVIPECIQVCGQSFNDSLDAAIAAEKAEKGAGNGKE